MNYHDRASALDEIPKIFEFRVGKKFDKRKNILQTFVFFIFSKISKYRQFSSATDLSKVMKYAVDKRSI